MTDRAPNPSRTRTVLALLLLWPVLLVVWFWRSGRFSLRTKALATAVGVVVLAVAAGVSGAGSPSNPSAEDAQAGATTITTTYGPEYLAPTAPDSNSSSSSAPSSTAPPATATTGARPAVPAPAPQPTPDPGPTLPAGDNTTVERVVDGDTIVVAGGTRVRLIGMDTPETQDPRTSVQCFGPEAARHMPELLSAGTPVRLVYDVERTDRYGRTLAYVHRLSDGLFVNVALVRDGFARLATYPPNVAHVEEIHAAETEARDAGRGLWGGCPAGGSTPTTTAPPSTVVPAPTGGGACDPSYPDVCIPPAPPDRLRADHVPEHPGGGRRPAPLRRQP